MAYFQKNNNEDDQKNQNNTGNIGGNVYHTSSSEIESSTVSSNNPTTSNKNNSSGNWVNLNKYIDSNYDKSGNYANKIVSEDLNKGDQHKIDVENQKTNFGNAVRQAPAYKYGSDQSSKTAKNYYNDSSSVSDEDLDTFWKASKGYQGVGEFNTYDGYDNLKGTSDYFGNLTSQILDPTYRAANKMDSNLTTGSKKLNNLVLTSDVAKKNLNNASNQFSLLSGLLSGAENEANKDRESVVNVANANAQALKENQQKAEAEALTKLKASKDAADKSKQAKQNQASQVKTYKAPVVNLWGQDIDIGSFTGKDTSKFFNSGRSTQDAYTQEENEIKQRGADLLSGNRSGNSKLDLINDDSSYDSINATFQQWNEEGRVGNLPSIINEAYKITQNLNEDRGIMTEDYVRSKIEDVILNNKTVRNAMQSYVRGNMDKETLRSIIVDSIPRYTTAGAADWIARGVSAVGDFFGSLF